MVCWLRWWRSPLLPEQHFSARTSTPCSTPSASEWAPPPAQLRRKPWQWSCPSSIRRSSLLCLGDVRLGNELFLGAQMNKNFDLVRNFLRQEDGVTAIEYGLLAALVAVAIITGATLLGTNLNALFNALGVRMGTAAGTAAA